MNEWKDKKQSKELLSLYEITVSESNAKKSVLRKKILETLINSKEHLSAEQIYQELNQNNEKVGIATIYRSLKFLEDNQLVSTVLMNKTNYFEPNYKIAHDHLICDCCKKVIEFFDKTIEMRQRKIAKENGFILKSHSLVLNGLCSECAKNNPLI